MMFEMRNLANHKIYSRVEKSVKSQNLEKNLLNVAKVREEKKNLLNVSKVIEMKSLVNHIPEPVTLPLGLSLNVAEQQKKNLKKKSAGGGKTSRTVCRMIVLCGVMQALKKIIKLKKRKC